MVQYHMLVNLDKREYVHPHRLGDGLKLVEQINSCRGGIGSALIALLAVSNGDGDLEKHEVVGRWGGDRVAIVGDSAEPEDLPEDFEAELIYDLCIDQKDRQEQIDYLRHGPAVDIFDRWERFSRSARLEESEPYTDISTMVQDFLIAQGVVTGYSGTGWLTREVD